MVKPRLLLVDDVPTNITVLMDALAQDGYDFLIAIDGENALEVVRQSALDLVLLDIVMPGMDGFEVLQRLKLNPETRDIPVIIITGKNDVEDETRGLQLGAVDYITKPFNPSVVQARVSTHLALQSAHRQLKDLNEQLLSEREIVEDIVVKMRRSDQFDDRNLRFLIRPLEKTTGDILFSARRPDGGQHLMMGDFTGHGLTAAIGGPLVSDTFYVKTALGVPMAEIFSELNRKLHAILREDMFLAACFLDMNAERDRLTIWNSGLHDVFIFRDGEPHASISSSHMPRGLLNLPDQPGQVIPVRTGDRIYVYSDGIVEEMDHSEKMYGKERLREVIHKIVREGLSLDHVIDDLERFRGGGEQADDILLAEWTC